MRTDERTHTGKGATSRGQLLIEQLNNCQTWIMSGHTFNVTHTSAAAATPASRTAPSSSISAEPTCINAGAVL
jgi:hypothetical protein